MDGGVLSREMLATEVEKEGGRCRQGFVGRLLLVAVEVCVGELNGLVGFDG